MSTGNANQGGIERFTVSPLEQSIDFAKAVRRTVIRTYRSVLREQFRMNQQSCYDGHDVTILSSNCLGGIIYNTLGLKFSSPTINMFIKPHDFVTLVERLPEFTSVTKGQFELLSSSPYPIVRLGSKESQASITLHCVHYSSFEEIRTKWIERQQRIIWDRVCLIMSERDGCTQEDIMRFDALAVASKVCFAHESMFGLPSVCHLPGTEIGVEGDLHRVCDLTQYENWHSGKRIVDRYDYVGLLHSARGWASLS